MANPAPDTSFDDARSYLSALFDSCDAGVAVVYTLPGKITKSVSLKHPDAIERLANIAVQLSGRENVYVSVCPSAEPPEAGSRNTTNGTRVVPAVWVELDVKAGAFATMDALLSFVNNLPLKPSILIHSGGGVHCYWLLDSPFVIRSDEDRDRIQETTRRWLAFIKQEARKVGAAVDSTADLARVLRIPGTFNRKEAKNIRPVSILHLDPAVRHSLIAIERCVPDAPTTKERPTAPSTMAAFAVDEEIILKRATRTENFRGWLNGDNRTAMGAEDASASDQSFCNALVGCGADRHQVDSIFRRSARMRDKWDRKHFADGRTYGAGTLDTAFDGSIQNRYERNLIAFPSTATRTPIESGELPATFPDEAVVMIADLRAQVAEWRSRALSAELRVEELTDEVIEIRKENTAIINVATSPHLKAEAASILRAVTHAHKAKQQGKADEAGFVQVSAAAIGDDYDNIETPVRARATVKRHLEKAADLGLLEREVRPGRVQYVQKGKDGNPVIDPETKKPIMVEKVTDLTWIKVTGDSVAEMLRPFALFRGSDSDNESGQPVKKQGGDRRSAAFQATRTPCPDCGSTERKTYCVGCGSDVTEIVEADEIRAYDAVRESARTSQQEQVFTVLSDQSQSIQQTQTNEFQQALAAWAAPSKSSADQWTLR